MTLSREKIENLLRYDPQTGEFFWRVARGKGGRTKAGSRAGADNGGGYIRINIDGRNWYAHRLAWVIMHGAFPVGEIDHINRNRSDNRISNLRLANHAQNTSNDPKRKNNTSGFKGVSRDHSSMFRATIWCQGKQKYLGSFRSREEAYAAYCKAARELHGEFARFA